MARQPIIFDFKNGRVYRSTDDPQTEKDLMKVLKAALRRQRRMRLTVGSTPVREPPTLAK